MGRGGWEERKKGRWGGVCVFINPQRACARRLTVVTLSVSHY